MKIKIMFSLLCCTAAAMEQRNSTKIDALEREKVIKTLHTNRVLFAGYGTITSLWGATAFHMAFKAAKHEKMQHYKLGGFFGVCALTMGLGWFDNHEKIVILRKK